MTTPPTPPTPLAPLTPATVVLVHGAWHGNWCWERVTPLLDARGIRFVLVDRGIGEPRVVSSDLWIDRARVQEAVRAVDGPVVLLGHSQGGLAITYGGMAPNVRRLVYLGLDLGRRRLDARAHGVVCTISGCGGCAG